MILYKSCYHNLKFQLSMLLDSFADSTVKALKLPQGDYTVAQEETWYSVTPTNIFFRKEKPVVNFIAQLLEFLFTPML